MSLTKEDLQSIRVLMQEEINPLRDDVSGLKDDVLKINIAIEHELRPNIKLLAEGQAGIIERLDRIEAKTAEIDDIKETVAILKTIAAIG